MNITNQFGAVVTLSQLEPILRRIVSSPQRGKISVVLWGPPGVGKTAMTRQVAAEAGVRYIRYDLPQIDYIQMTGVPKFVSAEGREKAIRVPIIDIPESGDGVYVIDDFTHAPNQVQNVALDLALEHRLNDARLGDGWLLIMCANDAGGVHPMQPPVANRMLHFYVIPDMNSFRDWALGVDIRSEIVSFLDHNADALYREPVKQEKAFPTPRSWEKLSIVLDSFYSDFIERRVPTLSASLDGEVEYQIERTFQRVALPVDDSSLSMLNSVVSASVGGVAATELLMFLRTYNMIDIAAFEQDYHPTLESMLEKIGCGAKKGAKSMADQQALEFALVGQARGWWSPKADWVPGSKSKADTEGRRHWAKFLVRCASQLRAHNRAILMRDIAVRDRARYDDLSKHLVKDPELSSLSSIFADFGKIFSGRV